MIIYIKFITTIVYPRDTHVPELPGMHVCNGVAIDTGGLRIVSFEKLLTISWKPKRIKHKTTGDIIWQKVIFLFLLCTK